MAGPEALLLAPRGQLEQGEDGDLRPPAVLVLLDEAVFEAEFRIAVTVVARLTLGSVERQRGDDMELPVGDQAVIELEARRHTRRLTPDVGTG